MIITLNLSCIWLNYKTEAVGNNEIFKNETIAVPLKYLNKFWRSLEMSLNNSETELQLKLSKYCFFCI